MYKPLIPILPILFNYDNEKSIVYVGNKSVQPHGTPFNWYIVVNRLVLGM